MDVPVHEDVSGERLGAEGALLQEVVALGDVTLVDVEHGRRRRWLHVRDGTAPLHHAACGEIPSALGGREVGAMPP
jgi:hypothetical protein